MSNNKQEIYDSIIDKIIVQEGESVNKKDFKSLILSDFSEEELQLLKDFYTANNHCDKIDEDISKLRLNKLNPEKFFVKIKTMNLRQLSIEIKVRKDKMQKIDDCIIFKSNITDEDESDYYKAERELKALEKQIKTITKGKRNG